MKNIRDTLVGIAYGDSFGMPVELVPRAHIQRTIGRLESLEPGQPGNMITSTFVRGEVTDDTIFSMLLCEQLIAEGDIHSAHYFERIIDWMEHHEKSRFVVGPSTRRAAEQFKSGVPLEEIGSFGETNGAAMRIAPIGIFFDVHQLDDFVRAVYRGCLPTHNTAIAVSGACAIAAAVSYGTHGGTDVQEMLLWVREAAKLGRQFGRDLGYPFIEERLDLLLKLLPECADDEARAKLLHEGFGTSIQTIESVPTAIAAAVIHQTELREAVRFTANLGGDTDTISSMCGAICGAMRGVGKVADADIALLEHVNLYDFGDIAERLAAAIQGKGLT